MYMYMYCSPTQKVCNCRRCESHQKLMAKCQLFSATDGKHWPASHWRFWSHPAASHWHLSTVYKLSLCTQYWHNYSNLKFNSNDEPMCRPALSHVYSHIQFKHFLINLVCLVPTISYMDPRFFLLLWPILIAAVYITWRGLKLEWKSLQNDDITL